MPLQSLRLTFPRDLLCGLDLLPQTDRILQISKFEIIQNIEAKHTRDVING